MSVRHTHANAYAAIAQLDGAVSEVEQRRLEQQGEVLCGGKTSRAPDQRC